MYKQILFSIFLLILGHQSLVQATCTNNRYINPIFSVDVLQEPANFATSVPSSVGGSQTATTNIDLSFDVYMPQAGTDTLTKRPLIIMAFGGAFITGWKRQPQLVDFANAFAERGYVVACIDYRLGFSFLDQQTAIRAVYRAVQDMKAAIRYFKEHATTYNIDTNYVFAGGNSAGSISAIHSAYLVEADRAASPLMAPTYCCTNTFGNWPDLGCADCSGNSYTHNSQPDLIINLWGAIGDVVWIENSEAPIISFHGDADTVVDPNCGAPFGASGLFPALCGSIPMHAQANSVGLLNELHVFPGAGHEVWTNSADALFINQETADFMYDFMRPALPAVSGNTTVCSGAVETYSVPATAGSVYCWNVTGGTIISTNPMASTIDVQWGVGTTGMIDVREITCNVYESNLQTINVTISNINTPTALTTANVTFSTADLSWSAPTVTGFTFNVQYRPVGTATWTTVTGLTTNATTLTNLTSCTDYEFQVQEQCSSLITSSFSASQTFTTDCVRAKVKVFLEGAYTASLNSMSTALRMPTNILPLNQPYNTAPWNYSGTENVTNIANIPNNTTDWVLVELRDAGNNNMIVAQAAGFLLSDGNIQDVDGTIGLRFPTLTSSGNYYLVVRHRNHLAVMSSVAVNLPNIAPYDFTTASGQAMANQQVNIGLGVVGCYTGDINNNGIISVSDFNEYVMQQSTAGYIPSDCSLDGNNTVADFNLYRGNASMIGISQIRY